MVTPFDQIPAALSGGPAPHAGGVEAPVEQRYCDGCERAVAATGCRRWERYTLCARCQQEYLAAWAAGRRMSPGQYIRDKRFGESETYRLPD
ncbi:MAG TPA: hypothetical protein VKV26_22920 [Dehalococcoidia bacterium]|nr:hypothetical protein [Dehalococcoidia bacterium]